MDKEIRQSKNITPSMGAVHVGKSTSMSAGKYWADCWVLGHGMVLRWGSTKLEALQNLKKYIEEELKVKFWYNIESFIALEENKE